VSKGDEKYQSYMTYFTHVSNRNAIFSGFTFTVITLLITLHPDVTSLNSQVVLFILMLLFYILVHQVVKAEMILMNCVTTAPPIPPEWQRHRRRHALIFEESRWILFCLSVVLLYFLWNLVFLAITSLILLAVIYVYTLINSILPMMRFTHPTRGARELTRE
jgi:hypothetical protein